MGLRCSRDHKAELTGALGAPNQRLTAITDYRPFPELIIPELTNATGSQHANLESRTTCHKLMGKYFLTNSSQPALLQPLIPKG